MNETKQASPTVEPIDLLLNLDSIDLTTVDRSFPLYREQSLHMKFAKMETKPNKTKTGHNLVITLEQVQPTAVGEKSGAEVQLAKGFKLLDRISLVKTEAYNPAEKLADIQLATYGEQRVGFRLSDYLGKDVMVRVTIDEGNDEFPKSNRVRYIKKAAVSAAVSSL